MSQTIPVDVVSRSYWAYVASAMVEGLGQIADGGQPNAIPRRVYVDAQEFFHLALGAAGEEVPQNPSASIANYIIAANAAKVAVPLADRAQVQTRLQTYETLLTRLCVGAALSPQEVETSRGLREFFVQVLREAETEAYERVVHSEAPQSRFRMR